MTTSTKTALLVTIAMGAAACGGSSTDSSSSVAGTSAPSSTPAPTTTPPTTARPSTTVIATTVPADETVPATPPATDPSVQAVIDIGGGEAYGLTADEHNVWAVSFSRGSLARIDPASDTVVDVVEVGSAASVLAVGTDIWVVGFGMAAGSSSLFRVDAASVEVVATVHPGELCCDLTFGNGILWALDPSGRVLGIDPADGEVVAELPVELDRLAHSNVVFAGESLWVSSDTTALQRIDPQSGEVDEIDVGGGVPFLAEDGLLWGASPETVWALNERTGEEVRRIALTDSIEVLSLAVAGGTLWAGIRHPGRVGAVVHVDIATGDVLDEFDVDIPARAIVAFGSVWVTDSGASEVVRIGPL